MAEAEMSRLTSRMALHGILYSYKLVQLVSGNDIISLRIYLPSDYNAALKKLVSSSTLI
jgi:hypothetical protein